MVITLHVKIHDTAYSNEAKTTELGPCSVFGWHIKIHCQGLNRENPIHYPTRGLLGRLGLLKQGVTIFIVTQMTSTQKKIPAQRRLEPQATCSLGLCHGSLTLTGVRFSSAFYHT